MRDLVSLVELAIYLQLREPLRQLGELTAVLGGTPARKVSIARWQACLHAAWQHSDVASAKQWHACTNPSPGLAVTRHVSQGVLAARGEVNLVKVFNCVGE